MTIGDFIVVETGDDSIAEQLINQEKKTFMALSTANELIESVKNIILQDTQLQKYRLDLTVTEIHEYESSGSLDFGGSEFEPASTNKLDPVKKDSDDSYGWWNLAGGTYLAICNETIQSDNNASIMVTAHPHAVEAGLMINTIIAANGQSESALRIPIRVPGVGCKIKENARFASAYIISG